MKKHKILAWRLLSVLVVLTMLLPATFFVAPMPVTQAADTGWRSPSADAADTGGDGDGFENNPTYAYASGGDYASNQDGPDDNHRYYNFGFDSVIPTDAAINGIEVRLDGWADSTDNSPRYDVDLSWDGGSSWSDVLHSTSTLADSQTTSVLGDQNDLWDSEHTWSASDLSNANFRVRITARAFNAGSEDRDFFLDWVAVRVYYASAHINGTVWADDNANGVQDGGETGLNNIHVTIYQDDGDDTFEGGGQDPEVGSDDTDTDGAYDTGPFMDGNSYWIEVDTPANRYLTTPPEPRLVYLPDGNPVTVNFGYAPLDSAIEIAKTPDPQMVVSGGTAIFTIAITNTGDVTLTDVVVSDIQASDCVRAAGQLPNLDPDASTSYECNQPNVLTDFTNSATATGTPPIGDDVTDTDTAAVIVIDPDIQIAKTPDTQTVVRGSTVTFTIAVTNTGDVTLEDVNVTDAQAPDCARVIGELTPEGSTSYASYECTLASVTDSFVNVATVTGSPPAGGDVTAIDTASVNVIAPAIEIAKTPEAQTVLYNSTATFTIAVANTGDVALTNVTVSDDLAPNCAATLGTLAAEDSTSYECTLGNVLADFTNSATVTGTPPIGDDVIDTDTAFVDVIAPAIAIAKTPGTQMVASGTAANFTIAVTNTGDVVLTNVAVSDAQAPDCDAGPTTLGIGLSWSYSCAVDDVTDGFINSAIVTGRPSVGNDVTDADAAKVRLDETQPCPADMIAYWKLDETGSPTYDDFYDGHDGECAGSCPVQAPGHINGGQEFDGSTTGIDVPAVPGDDSFNWSVDGSFSIEFWMQTDSASTCAGNQVIVGRDDSSNGLHWWTGCRDGGPAGFSLGDT
ncbi:MAG: SdrD B-like domain-containing protein, partial [Chloroflexota bacterium]|nr:SdrD B-like domain-containing protein [Chloroflexota bacterium]